MKRLTVTYPVPDKSKHPKTKLVEANDSVHRYVALNRLFYDEELYALNQYWGDPNAYEDEIAAWDHLKLYELVPGPGDSFFTYTHTDITEPDAWVRDVSRESGAFYDRAEYPTTEGEVRTNFIGDHSALQSVMDTFRTEVITVERLQAYGVTSSGSGVRTTLTARQQEAVEAACESGYYDVPRTGSMADIAARLDCTKATASEILRRAESSAMKSLAE